MFTYHVSMFYQHLYFAWPVLCRYLWCAINLTHLYQVRQIPFSIQRLSQYPVQFTTFHFIYSSRYCFLSELRTQKCQGISEPVTSLRFKSVARTTLKNTPLRSSLMTLLRINSCINLH